MLFVVLAGELLEVLAAPGCGACLTADFSSIGMIQGIVVQ
jgi:hypothetical protein